MLKTKTEQKRAEFLKESANAVPASYAPSAVPHHRINLKPFLKRSMLAISGALIVGVVGLHIAYTNDLSAINSRLAATS